MTNANERPASAWTNMRNGRGKHHSNIDHINDLQQYDRSKNCCMYSNDCGREGGGQWAVNDGSLHKLNIFSNGIYGTLLTYLACCCLMPTVVGTRMCHCLKTANSAKEQWPPETQYAKNVITHLQREEEDERKYIWNELERIIVIARIFIVAVIVFLFSIF